MHKSRAYAKLVELLHSEPTESSGYCLGAAPCRVYYNSPDRWWPKHGWVTSVQLIVVQITLLAMTATCFSTRHCKYRTSPGICTRSVWVSCNPTHDQRWYFSKSQRASNPEPCFSLLLPIQTPGHWEKAGVASLNSPMGRGVQLRIISILVLSHPWWWMISPTGRNM